MEGVGAITEKRKGVGTKSSKTSKYYVTSKEAIDRDVGENKTEDVPSRF